jgi:hypothetical protein
MKPNAGPEPSQGFEGLCHAPLLRALDLALLVHELRLDARHMLVALHHFRIVVRRAQPLRASCLQLPRGAPRGRQRLTPKSRLTSIILITINP